MNYCDEEQTKRMAKILLLGANILRACGEPGKSVEDRASVEAARLNELSWMLDCEDDLLECCHGVLDACRVVVFYWASDSPHPLVTDEQKDMALSLDQLLRNEIIPKLTQNL